MRQFMRSSVAALLLFLLPGCSDTERLDRLESEIRAMRSDSKDEGASLEKMAQRCDELEKKIADALSSRDDGEGMAYLRANVNGHAALQTDHGPFLVRLESIDLNVAERGFTLHLNVGNPLSITVQQALLKGDFGTGAPTLAEGVAYSAKNPQIEAWLKTLKPFEHRITKPLLPMSWTPVDVVVESPSRDELQLIRLKMVVENASLDTVNARDDSGSQSFAHIYTEGESASVLKTDYGAFLILVRKTEPSGSGTRLDIEIGNPYGFTINMSRLTGDFGGVMPKRRVGESQEQYLASLQEWSSGLKPFSSPVEGKLGPLRWNQATVLVPGAPAEVKFLRAQMRIENVTLPQVTEDLDKVPRFKR